MGKSDPVLRALGLLLRALREDAGLSQDKLAGAAGLTAKYLSEVENGHVNPSVLVLHALAEKGLKIPLAALFAYDTAGRELQDEQRVIKALLGSQTRDVRRRALHVLRALVEPLPKLDAKA